MTSIWLYFFLCFILSYPGLRVTQAAMLPQRTSTKMSKCSMHWCLSHTSKEENIWEPKEIVPKTYQELGCAPLREIESGREKNGLVYLIDGRDRQGWCLLVIKIWSDTGMATIWFYLTMSGNKWVSSCATKAASHEASKKTHRAVRPAKSPPTVKDITTHPACRHATSLLLFLKPTAALAGKQLKLLMIS